MKINKNDPRLTAFVLNELSAAEHHLIEQAVKADPELQSEVLLLQKTVGVLSQPQDSEVYRLEPEQRQKLFPKLSSWSIWTLSGGLATAALAVMLFNRTNFDQQPEMAKSRSAVVVSAPAEIAMNEKPEPAKPKAEKKEMMAPSGFEDAKKGTISKEELATRGTVAESEADAAFNEGADGRALGSGGSSAAAPAASMVAAAPAPAPQAMRAKAKMDSMEKSADKVSDDNQELIERLQACFAGDAKYDVLVRFKIKEQRASDLTLEGSGVTAQAKICIETLMNKQKWFKSTKTEYRLKLNSK